MRTMVETVSRASRRAGDAAFVLATSAVFLALGLFAFSSNVALGVMLATMGLILGSRAAHAS
ncbi:MAG: hypothetical protein ACYDCK_02205 [Thermoplasmatota archaeon]